MQLYQCLYHPLCSHTTFQHVVFGIVKLIDVVIPDIPGSVQLKIDIDATIAKLVLDDDNTVMVSKRACNFISKYRATARASGIGIYLTYDRSLHS